MCPPVGKGKLKDTLEVRNTYFVLNPVSCKAEGVFEQDTLGQGLPEFTPEEIPQVIVEPGSFIPLRDRVVHIPSVLTTKI